MPLGALWSPNAYVSSLPFPSRRRDHLHSPKSSHKDELPLYNAVKERSIRDEVALHVPGHKRGKGISESLRPHLSPSVLALDLTEIAGLDYLSYPDGPILKAQQLAAHTFCAKQTWFLVNGTTTGIHAAVLATCRPGDALVLPRNCHLACFNALVLGDLEPVWMQPEYDGTTFQVAHGVHVDSVREAIAQGRAAGRRIGAVLLVSPTYYGAISDIASIAALCREHGVPLIVDEAHGAHLGLHRDFPKSAVQLGADLVVQSTHKMLGSMTQSAMLHLSPTAAVDPARISKTLQALQSSSPSYVLMSSLDGARHWAQTPDNFEGPTRAIRYLETQLVALEPRVRILHRHYAGQNRFAAATAVAWDPWRLVVAVEGLSGYDLADRLEREFGVVPELSTQRLVALLFGPGSDQRDAERTAAAFETICALTTPKSEESGAHRTTERVDPIPTRRVSPRQAFFSEAEAVPAEDAVGRISAELLSPYPPGIPLVVPGEVLTPEIIQRLRDAIESGAKVTGATDGTLRTVRVLLSAD